MYGDAAFADRPWAALEDIRFFAYGYAEIDVSFDFIIYAATREFATEPDDVPPSRPFRGVLRVPLAFRRSILGSEIASYATGDGSLVIDNADAFYDFLIQQYAVDGREIRIKIGRPGVDPFDEFFVCFQGTASDWEVGEESLTVLLRDNGYRLLPPAQPNTYGGTGGADGGADLAGKRRPLSYGYVPNVPPPLVSPTDLIYQVHDGPVFAITAVYDRGVALTLGDDYATYALLAAATTAAGEYDTCLAEGYFQLGSTPSGTITADVSGDVDDAVFFATTSAEIVQRMILNATDLEVTDFDGDSFDDLNVAAPADIGYWLGPDDTSTVADVASQIMRGIGGWIGFRRNGNLYVNQFVAPSGVPAAIYDHTDLVGDATTALRRERLPTGTVPPWRYRVGYERNWTQQTDLASSVSDARRAFVAETYRLAEASDSVVLTDHPLARDPEPIEGFFANQADALAEAERQLALYRTVRGIYRMTLPRKALLRDLGDVIKVTYPRFDLGSGRLMTIVEINENLSQGELDTVEVIAYG